MLNARLHLLAALGRPCLNTTTNLKPYYNGSAALSTNATAKSVLACQEIVANPGSIQGKGSATMTALFLHGLLGSGRNWRSFARKLVGQAAENGMSLRVLLLDLRNHGQTTANKALHPPHSLEAAARDVQDFIHTTLGGEVPGIVVGHSLGGKVALELLQQLAGQPTASTGLPRQVWVLDSQPGKVDHISTAADNVAHIIETIKSIPLPIPSRQWLYTHLQPLGISQGTVQWLGSNLVGKDGSLYWSFNIQGAAAMYQSYRVRSYWQLLERPPEGTSVHVVRAEQSDRWTPDMLQVIHNCGAVNKEALKALEAVGKFHLHLLPNAGHWLHSDNPEGLLQLLLPSFLAEK